MRLNKATPNVTVARAGCISEGSIWGTILSSRTEKEGEGRRKRLNAHADPKALSWRGRYIALTKSLEAPR